MLIEFDIDNEIEKLSRKTNEFSKLYAACLTERGGGVGHRYIGMGNLPSLATFRSL